MPNFQLPQRARAPSRPEIILPPTALQEVLKVHTPACAIRLTSSKPCFYIFIIDSKLSLKQHAWSCVTSYLTQTPTFWKALTLNIDFPDLYYHLSHNYCSHILLFGELLSLRHRELHLHYTQVFKHFGMISPARHWVGLQGSWNIGILE